MDQLKGKVAVVTGAGSGIGRAIALDYAREGAKVVVSDIAQKGADECVNLIKEAGGEAAAVLADVGDPEACRRLVEATVRQYGRLDIACNNAGISGEQHPTADYTIENWQKVININLSSLFYCMKYQIPAMLKNGGGAITNIASILGQVGFGSSVAYVAAKHGVLGLTKTAAVDYAKQGVRVNAVGPGFIATPLLSVLEPAALEYIKNLHPMGRLGKPEEVASMVTWLSSDKASFVTGSYYPVDGGYLSV